MKYIVQNGNQFLVMSCSNELTRHEFIINLKKAVAHYVNYNSNGQKILEESGGNFSFSNLALISDDSSFLNILSIYDVFSFKADLIEARSCDINHDIYLVDKE